MENLDNAVTEATNGSDAAFETLWRYFYPRLLRYLAMFTKDAEDLCSEVWIKIAKAIRNFSGDAKAFQGWIFQIARNAATDHARKSKREGATSELQESDWISRDSSMVEVTDLLRRLPKDQAEVIMLRVIVGMEVELVADITGKSAANVRVLSHRGLLELKESLTISGYSRRKGGAHNE